MKTPLLLLLLVLLHVTTIKMGHCPSLPDKSLTCSNDYDSVITCVWKSTYVSDRADTVCTIYAERVHLFNGYKGSCKLKPVDVSRPTIQRCSVDFEREARFQSTHMLTINVSCNHMQNVSISYWPICHIKLKPPPKPEINFTTFSWVAQVTRPRIPMYKTQLLWKQEDQSWSDPSLKDREINKTCQRHCTAEIGKDLLIIGEKYEARVRVKTAEDGEYFSTWSDWSPTASWVSHTGEPKPTPPPSDVAQGVLGTVACVVALVLLLILFRTDKTTWIYIAKKIRGPPLPNPGKSFLQGINFQNSPHFTSDSFQSFLRPVEITSVEVTSTVDAVAPSGQEAALREKMRSESSYETTSSNFSNPSYSKLPPPPPLPPVSLLTAGNLEACGVDTPYGPVGCQGEVKSAEQDRDDVRGKEVEILRLPFKCSNNSEPMLLISDYEKVEKPQVERLRLQSLDSGVCSGEEVSQESLEADSINVTDCHDEVPGGKVEREGGNGEEVHFQKLFKVLLDKGSMQVCSGYEQVQKLQVDAAELPSLDSGISSGGEEQLSQEESLEDVDKSTESTSLLFPPPSPPPPSALACSSPTFTPLVLNFSEAGFSPVLPPLPCLILERIALMSANRPVEPSGDGYMPVRQEQS